MELLGIWKNACQWVLEKPHNVCVQNDVYTKSGYVTQRYDPTAIYNKAKLRNELTPSQKKKNRFAAITLSFFFLLSFSTCVHDHRIIL